MGEHSNEYDPEYENPLDVVVQHMVAADFSYEEISHQLKVTKDYIISVCTPNI